jgi:tetratricopeptide (TPR) repeat protein
MTFIQRFLRVLPKSCLSKAIDYLSSGDYAKACNQFEIYISKKDHFSANDEKQELIRMYMSEAYIEYAKLLRNNGKFLEAYELLQKVISLEPEYSDVYYMAAELNEKLGRLDQSRDNVRRALSINPNYFSARIFLAKLVYLLDKKSVKCVEELKKSLSCAPGFYVEKVKILARDIKNGSEEKNILLQFDDILRERPSSAQVSKQIALENIQQGDYNYAITELKKALSVTPDFADLRNMLGIAFANKGLKDDAILEFKTALKINPEYLKAHLNLALTYYEKSSFEESLRHLEKVIQIDPENELALNLKEELIAVLN